MRILSRSKANSLFLLSLYKKHSLKKMLARKQGKKIQQLYRKKTADILSSEKCGPMKKRSENLQAKGFENKNYTLCEKKI